MFKNWRIGNFLLTIHRQYPEFGVHLVKMEPGIAFSVDIGSWGIILDYSNGR